MSVLELFLWSVGFSLVLALIYRFLTKPEEMRRIRRDLEFYKKKMNEAQKNGKQDEMKKYLDMSIKANQEYMKFNMKPMIFSMILFLVLLSFLNTAYANLVVPLPVSLPVIDWTFPFIHLIMEYNWFWWYLVVTVPFTYVFRKLLGVE